MATNPDIADDPWALDDYTRRAMQFLFRETVDPVEAARRRDVRVALLGIFSAVTKNDAIDVQDAMNLLWDQYRALYERQIEARVLAAPPPDTDEEQAALVEAHQNDFDVVATQPAPEIA